MQDKITKCLGLVTQYNPLTVAPGALRRADNASHRRENVTEPRRGHKLYGTFANNPKKALTYLNRVLIHQGTKLSYDNGSGTFADYTGNYTAPTSTRMRFVEAFSNLYVTTNAGVKVFSDITGAEGRLSGAPRALDPSYTLNGSTGFLANGDQCAYRCVIRRTDAQSNIITGYPSQRLWVANSSGGNRNVELTVYIPSEAKITDVIQFYRTEAQTGTTDDISADEMGLIYQYELTSSDISTGYIVFVDSVVDELRGATLYTSPSQEGIGQANERPPLAKDICLYKSNYMFYANTQTKQRLSCDMVGVSALGHTATGDTTNASDQLTNVSSTTYLAAGWKVSGPGIQAGTTILSVVGTTVTLSLTANATATGVTISFYSNQTLTLGGATYNFGSSEIITGVGAPQIQVSTTGVAAVDIDLTARSLVRTVNRYASNTTVYAYYNSGPSDLPGKILFEEKGLGASAFTLQSSNTNLSAMFFPAPPVSPSTNIKSTSSNDVKKNYVYYSKTQQPEHVPGLNYEPIGAGNKEILRIIALKGSVIVIKEEGIYRIVGQAPPFIVEELDLTVFCKAPESVAVLANQIFMLSNQGVVKISDNGVEVVSHDIEPELTPLLSIPILDDNTFACSYESERSYFLSTLTDSVDTVNNQTLVYNTATKVWNKHTYAIEASIVEPTTDKMFFSKPGSPRLFTERKDFADTDYADPEFDINITSINGRVIEFTIAGGTPAECWTIAQGTTEIPIEMIVLITDGFRATVKDDPPDSWETGAAIIYPDVGFDVEWHAYTGPAASADTLKQIYSVGFLTDDIVGNNSVSSFEAYFSSNFDQERESVRITQPSQGWGAAWGTSPWGGSGDPYGYPTWPPRNKQYCTRFYVGVRKLNAREKMSIVGIAFAFNAVSERIGR